MDFKTIIRVQTIILLLHKASLKTPAIELSTRHSCSAVRLGTLRFLQERATVVRAFAMIIVRDHLSTKGLDPHARSGSPLQAARAHDASGAARRTRRHSQRWAHAGLRPTVQHFICDSPRQFGRLLAREERCSPSQTSQPGWRVIMRTATKSKPQALPAQHSPAMITLQLAQSRPPPAPAPPDRPASTP